MKRLTKSFLAAGILATGLFGTHITQGAAKPDNLKAQVLNSKGQVIETIDIDDKKYPESTRHWKQALTVKGSDGALESKICTIKRTEADANRKASLKGIPTKKGYDRDEFPFAMCDEGGQGADVKLIKLSDNRGSGAFMGNKLRPYEDGTKVRFVIVK